MNWAQFTDGQACGWTCMNNEESFSFSACVVWSLDAGTVKLSEVKGSLMVLLVGNLLVLSG